MISAPLLWGAVLNSTLRERARTHARATDSPQAAQIIYQYLFYPSL